MSQIYTANELVHALALIVAAALDGVTVYEECLPDPALTRPAPKAPLAVVQSIAGTDSRERSTVQINIAIERAMTDDDDIVRVHKTIRDDIAAVKLAIYHNPTGCIGGTHPGQAAWTVYDADMRPAVQARISITFEVPHPVYENGEFLV